MTTWEQTYTVLLDRLRNDGERLTLQRKMVLQALCQGCGHRTIGQIGDALHAAGQPLDESTIYRILQRFNRLGIVSQTYLGADGIVYELLDGQTHHHLVCLACHQVLHVDDQFVNDMRTRLRQEYGFEPRIDHLAIFGLCAACQQ